MRLRFYQVGELIGIVFLLAATAVQLFYLEPLKRGIEWRLAAYATQQSAQVQVRTQFDNQLALLKLMKAPAEQVKETEERRAKTLDKFQTADANIADYMIAKERVEGILQVIVLIVFGIGTLLAGVGRALEMRAAPEGR